MARHSGSTSTSSRSSRPRSGSTTLQSLLNHCVNDAFIQGENDFSVWWLYKHALSTASYELYTKQSTTYARMKSEYDEPSMPFYQKVVPEQVRNEQRALVMATIAHSKRARVVGFKEVRWLERVQQDHLPGDSFWDKDDRRGALRGYRTGNTTQRPPTSSAGSGAVPDLHVIVLTRDPAGQSKSACSRRTPTPRPRSRAGTPCSSKQGASSACHAIPSRTTSSRTKTCVDWRGFSDSCPSRSRRSACARSSRRNTAGVVRPRWSALGSRGRLRA